MTFALTSLIPDVMEAIRSHLREGTESLTGLDDIEFLVRQGTGDNDPGVTAPPAVIFPDDKDPGVPIVRVTMESIVPPEGNFEEGDEILIDWVVIIDCLAATKTGSRTAGVSADSAEGRLASATFALLIPGSGYRALEERGIERAKPRIDGLISRDRVFRYPIRLEFQTVATV